MKFLRDWLRPQPRPAILHPTATVELPCTAEEAFERCLQGIERVLGGVVRSGDPAVGRIEASFGLIDSERLSCTIERGETTRVIVESRAVISAEPRTVSPYVEALAAFLRSSATE